MDLSSKLVGNMEVELRKTCRSVAVLQDAGFSGRVRNMFPWGDLYFFKQEEPQWKSSTE